MIKINQRSNFLSPKLLLIIGLVLMVNGMMAGNGSFYEGFPDSTRRVSGKLSKSEKKEIRKQKRLEGKKYLKETHSRFLISYDFVFSSLKTRVTFNGPNGIINLALGLEDNLGLNKYASFSSIAFVYRITKRSGFYANYYGIKRDKVFYLEDDLPHWGGDTIPAGTSVNTYFNTHIASAGYIFSALTNSDAYLGFYANLYIVFLSTGISANNANREAELKYTMPLPNIGFVGSFNLTKWLLFHGSMGVFSLNTENYGGLIYDLSISLGVKPVNWMAINVSYKEFNIRLYNNNIKKQINATVEYNFNGPALGLTFKF